MSRRLLLGLAALALTTATFAGGPLYTFDYQNRIPYAWDMSRWNNGQVPVYTDMGALGPLTNERANEMVTFATQQWSSVPTSSFRNAVAGDFLALGLGDIDYLTVQLVIGQYNGGGIDIIYDSDGSIMTNFFGLPPTSVLGITDIEYVNAGTSEILEAWLVLSGPGIRADDTNGIGFQGVVTHEMGHALNLAHTQTNGAVDNFNVNDWAQPDGCGAPWSGLPNHAQVETMYPISTPEPGDTGEYMGTVDQLDDQSALSYLYPADGYPANRGSIAGTIMDASGNPVTGVNVIARNVAAPFADDNSYISGQVSKGQAGPDGSYSLNDLTPGGRYVLYVDNIEVGGFPVPLPIVLPGPEEYYNGRTEGPDAAVDHRCDWTTIEVAAGSTTTADITFGKYTGAPTLMVSPGNLIPTDMTPDGSIVVGGEDNNAPIARWNLDTGAYDELGGMFVGAASISDDGTKITGVNFDASNVGNAAIYTDATGWSLLPPVPGAVACNNSPAGALYSLPEDISGDGNTVVGLSYGAFGCSSGSTRGFRWTQAGGMVQLPKVNSLSTAGRANAVSYDGSVIVGHDEASTGFRRGEVWRNGVGSLILQPNHNWVGESLAITRDGHWVVGVGSGFTSGQSYKYNVTANAVTLYPNFGGTWNNSVASSTNDANTVVGGYSTDSTNGFLAPAIWTTGLSWFNFNTFLGAQGVNTAGIFIHTPNVLSADGTTMAGPADSRFGLIGAAIKSPTSVVCHAQQTTSVTFPSGLNAAIAAGDTLGPCACTEAIPTGTPTLIVDHTGGTANVQWSSVAGATGYDLVRGTLSALAASHGNFSTATTDCLEDALRANATDDGDTPADGDGFWYLVRAQSCGGHGTYDSGAASQAGSRDAGIQASNATCP